MKSLLVLPESGNTPLQKYLSESILMDCVMACVGNDKCQSFDYNDKNGQCLLFPGQEGLHENYHWLLE